MIGGFVVSKPEQLDSRRVIVYVGSDSNFFDFMATDHAERLREWLKQNCEHPANLSETGVIIFDDAADAALFALKFHGPNDG